MNARRNTFVAAALVLLITVVSGRAALAAQWTVSASELDPYLNTAAPTFGGRTLFLWYLPAESDSIAIADIGIALASGTSHLAPLLALGDAQVSNGVFGQGRTHGHYKVTVPTCSRGAAPVASFDVLDDGVGVCLDAVIGVCRSDCGEGWWTDASIGFASSGAPPCTTVAFEWCSPYPAVQPTSWGKTKSGYR